MASLSELRGLYSGQDIVDAYNKQYETELKKEMITAQALGDWAKAQQGLALLPAQTYASQIATMAEMNPPSISTAQEWAGTGERKAAQKLFYEKLSEARKDKNKPLEEALLRLQQLHPEYKLDMDQTYWNDVEQYRKTGKSSGGFKVEPDKNRTPQSIEEIPVEQKQPISELQLRNKLPIYEQLQQVPWMRPEAVAARAAMVDPTQFMSKSQQALTEKMMGLESERALNMARLSLQAQSKAEEAELGRNKLIVDMEKAALSSETTEGKTKLQVGADLLKTGVQARTAQTRPSGKGKEDIKEFNKNADIWKNEMKKILDLSPSQQSFSTFLNLYNGLILVPNTNQQLGSYLQSITSPTWRSQIRESVKRGVPIIKNIPLGFDFDNWRMPAREDILKPKTPPEPTKPKMPAPYSSPGAALMKTGTPMAGDTGANEMPFGSRGAAAESKLEKMLEKGIDLKPDRKR